MEKNIESMKKRAAEFAIEFVKDGQIIGIGTGSTILYAIQALGGKVRDGLSIIGVPTSKQSERIAKELNIPIRQLNDVDRVDIVIDGADEINPAFDMIKGGGGALTREKLVALAAKERVIVVDETKLVPFLGKSFRLPVEVLPYGWRYCQNCLQEIGCTVNLRTRDSEIFETDNGNYILDCGFDDLGDAEDLERRIKLIPGVIESGLFIGIADTLVIGYQGKIEVLKRGEWINNSGLTPWRRSF
jgi:ribose 5-phosphate isomerase A